MRYHGSISSSPVITGVKKRIHQPYTIYQNVNPFLTVLFPRFTLLLQSGASMDKKTEQLQVIDHLLWDRGMDGVARGGRCNQKSVAALATTTEPSVPV